MDRLEYIASLCEGSTAICDVGCDHAYVVIQAIKRYGVSRGIAADIALGPLQAAKAHVQEAHLEQAIELIQSNGFEKISFDSFDTAILCGMGGLLIIDILKPYLSHLKEKKLIIGAHSDVPLLRSFMLQNGFRIVIENALYDKEKYYEIMVLEAGYQPYDVYDCSYGPLLRRGNNTAFLKKHQQRQKLLENILLAVYDQRKEALMMELQDLKRVIKYPEVEKHFINGTQNYYCSYFCHQRTASTIVLCPGGGYQYTSPRESEPVVDAFRPLGYHVIVIHYRQTVEDAYPLPGTYVATAINEIAKDKRTGTLIGLGFSAGGHCLLEVLLHRDFYKLEPKISCLMLGYPVISSHPDYAHEGSFQNLLKEQAKDVALRERVSLEKQVTKDNAIDLFLWGTVTDDSVSVMNSYLLLEAYQKVHGNVEYHLFPFGGHGLSVANSKSSEGNLQKESPYIARWVEFAAKWLDYKLSNH